MSTRIDLYFKSYPDLELIEQNIVLAHTRTFVDVEFAQQGGTWSNFRPAIIDTGSPVSLIPHEIWKHCPVHITGHTTIGGLVRRDECQLDVLVGTLTLRFRDQEHVSDQFSALVYLATINTVPLIIGFESLLKQADIYLSFTRNTAYLDFPTRTPTGRDAIKTGKETLTPEVLEGLK